MRAFVTGGSGFVGSRLLRALRARGDQLRALARSESSARTVAERGAEPVRGDLHDAEALDAGMAGCELVVHLAARLGESGPMSAFMHDNVEGTQAVLDAARRAGVRRVVHMSTEAVLASGRPIVNADETAPRPADACRPYGLTKSLAEERVLAARDSGLDAVIVRPRFIWGRGDTTLLPVLVKLCRAGRFAWFSGGHYLTSTCHVDNVAAGTLAAADRGVAGGTYFLTDGEPVEFRAFISELLRTQGVDPPTRSIPLAVARILATVGEAAWHRLPLPGEPPLSTTTIALVGVEVTVDDSRARRELDYHPPMSRERGLAELRG